MQINEDVAAVVGHIYDTALDSALWLDNVERLCRLLDCHLGGIWIADDVTREGFLDISWNEPPGSVDAMYEHYIHVAPAAFFGPDLQAGDIFSCEACYDPAEFRKSEIYNGYYKAFGYGSTISALIWRDQSITARFSLSRPPKSGRMSDTNKKVLSFLLPHYCRAVQLQNSFGTLESRRIAAMGFVDGLPAGVVFLDRRGRILEANRAAREISASRDGFVLERDSVRGGTSAQNRLLSRLIGGALATGSGEGADSGGNLCLDRPSQRRVYEVLVSPVNGTAEYLPYVGAAVAVLVIVDPERTSEPLTEQLQHLYGLSPAEAWVAWGIASGHRQTELADERGVSPETIRTHLKRAMIKMDVRRTADLVRLVLTGPATLNSNGKGN